MPDTHEQNEITQEEIQAMIPRMMAFIFPNTPLTCQQKDAFDKAVRHQITHEKALLTMTQGVRLPDGTSGFTIGHFSMSFENGAVDGRITRRTLCDSARGELLCAGLLYRGVEGRR